MRFERKGVLSSSERLLFQVSANDSNLGDYSQAFSGAATPGAGELGRMPALESRLAWTTGIDDRDFTLGFSGHYGRGKNVASSGSTTLAQAVDSWGTAVD